jgi:hypothetical protein
MMVYTLLGLIVRENFPVQRTTKLHHIINAKYDITETKNCDIDLSEHYLKILLKVSFPQKLYNFIIK